MSRKAKKLTMFGRLGSYQCAWGQAGAEAMCSAGLRAVQVRRGCLEVSAPTDAIWDHVAWGSGDPPFRSLQRGGKGELVKY